VYTYPHPTSAQLHDAFACDVRSGVHASLARYAADQVAIMPPPAVAVDGDLVAFGFDDFSNPEGAVTEIDVEDLSHPPNFHTIVAGGGTPDIGPAKIVNIKVDGAADAVWMACASAVGSQPNDPRRQNLDFATGAAARCQRPGQAIWVYYTRGDTSFVQRLLDQGAKVDPLSLQLRGSIASWRDGVSRRSADISQAAARVVMR